MKTLLTFTCSLLISISTLSQITVTSTLGTSSGTTTTLKAAFDAINNGTYKGSIEIKISDNTTESASAVLYQSGYNATSSYTSVLIYPTVTGKTISGNLNAAMIDLNGADNVTFDGRLNATGSTKDLTVVNSSFSNTANTSVIRFINDATYNTIKYCTVKGSSAAVPGAIILFHTASSTGNNNNSINDNDITCAADSYRPMFTIYSASGGAPANSYNVISRNNIYNFLSKSLSSQGVYLYTQSGGWTISDNSFYETTAFVSSGNTTQTVISVNGMDAATAPHTISGNYIGGSGPNCSGTWTKTGNTYCSLTAISLAAFSTSSTANEIQGNTIKGFSYSNVSALSYGYFYGISVTGNTASTVNIGTTTGNIIGASTGTGSIVFTNSYSSGSTFYGIYLNMSSGTLTCKNNIIGSVTVANSVATNGANFRGIAKLSTTTTIISNNSIGSTVTANSIQASSAATGNVQTVVGIESIGNGPTTYESNTISNLTNSTTNTTAATASYTQGINANTGTNLITRNIISNLSFSGANTSATGTLAVAGIVFTNASAVSGQIISRNTVSGLTATYSDFAGYVEGIYFQSGSYISTIEQNFVHSITVTGATSTSASIYGVKIASGLADIINNIVSIGGNSIVTLYGISEPGILSKNTNVYNNTVYISGAPTSGSTNSYCLYSALGDNQRDFRNNILENVRSNNGASGKHYAIYLPYASGTGLTLDYNQYYVSGTGTVLGYFNSADVASIPIVTGKDASSVVANPSFASAGGTVAANYVASAAGNGIATNRVYVDFSDIIRSVSSPKMGAYENSSNGNTTTVYNGASLLGTYADLKTVFDRINDGTLTGNLTVKLNSTQILTASAVLNESGSGSASYSSINIYPTVSGVMIMGNLASVPLIDFNGADNVTFDGRVNATGAAKDLVIMNLNNSAVGSTAVFRYINDATNINVKYCIVKGATVNSVLQSAMVIFGTTTGTTGNDQNVFDNCTFTNISADMKPSYTFLFFGTAGKENTDITISNSYFENTLSPTGSSTIFLSANTNNVTITGNSFYETLSLSPLSATSYLYINISNSTGYGYTVSNNYFGGTAPQCSGTALTKLGSFSNTVNIIYIYGGAGTESSIQGNVIRNISWTNSSAGASFTAIFSMGTTVNVGNITGNTVGSLTGTGSITVTGGAAIGNNFFGIQLNSPLVSDIRNNAIGSITLSNASTNSMTFVGISKSGNNSGTISNNTIGGTTANSIESTSAATANAQNMTGLITFGAGALTISNNIIQNLTNRSANANTATASSTIGMSFNATGTATITGNTIRSITNACANNAANNTAAVVGLVLNAVTTGIQTLSGNSITDLSNSYPSFTGSVIGMYLSAGTVAANSIEKSFIQGLSVSAGSTTASLYGIKINAGNNTFSNNVISLGYKSNASQDGIIYGIYENGAAGTTNNLYFNSVSISGSLTTGSSASYALYSNAATNTRDVRNNIFSNIRSNNGASGVHYSAYFNYASTSNLTLNYNDYYISGTGTQLGYFNSANVSTLPLITGFDGSSSIQIPGFVDAQGALASNFIPSTNLVGLDMGSITIDYFDNLRTSPPTMGAIEYAAYLAVRWLGIQAQFRNAAAVIEWQVTGESQGAIYKVSHSNDGLVWEEVGQVKGRDSRTTTAYSYIHTQPQVGKNYYRIIEQEANGLLHYSKVVVIDNTAASDSRIVLGNPVKNGSLLVKAPYTAECNVFTMSGQLVYQQSLSAGLQVIDVSALSKGSYIIRIGKQTALFLVQ